MYAEKGMKSTNAMILKEQKNFNKSDVLETCTAHISNYKINLHE